MVIGRKGGPRTCQSTVECCTKQQSFLKHKKCRDYFAVNFLVKEIALFLCCGQNVRIFLTVAGYPELNNCSNEITAYFL